MENNENEKEKARVLAAIRRSGGCVSLDALEEDTGMNPTKLSAILGLLLREKRLLVNLNRAAEDCRVYRPRREELCDRFFHLLALHHAQERSVTFYASELCVTPKYLSTVVKGLSGKTASAWIREEVVREIEFRLCHTQCSVKEIAYGLNFSNCSFFGKFFKAERGVSPLLYRRAHACPSAAACKPAPIV